MCQSHRWIEVQCQSCNWWTLAIEGIHPQWKREQCFSFEFPIYATPYITALAGKDSKMPKRKEQYLNHQRKATKAKSLSQWYQTTTAHKRTSLQCWTNYKCVGSIVKHTLRRTSAVAQLFKHSCFPRLYTSLARPPFCHFSFVRHWYNINVKESQFIQFNNSMGVQAGYQ